MQKTGVIARFKTGLRAHVASLRYRSPSRKMKVVLVIGHDGSVGTIAYLASILRQAGHKVGVMTQQYVEVGKEHAEGSDQADISSNPYRVQSLLAQMRHAKCSFALIEVPPELPEHQFVGVTPHMVIVRRCGDDYTDQMTVKARLAVINTILSRRPRYLVFNRDDPCGAELAHLAEHEGVISFGTHQKADCKVTEVELHPKGSAVKLLIDHHTDIQIATHLAGKQAIYNATAAAAASYVLHMPIEAIEEGVTALPGLPSHCEFLDIARPYQIVLDAASSPGGLAETLETLKHFTKNRLVVMLSAPLGTPKPWLSVLGEITAKFADRIVVCDGEYNSEQAPQEVRTALLMGATGEGGEAKTEEVPDRHEAIEKVIGIARRGDIVVIAAMSLHPYRQLGRERMTWSDRKVIEDLFEG